MQLIKKKPPELLPHPVIYEVNLTVDVEVVEAFDEWLHDHTQDMLAIPGFISANTSVVDDQDEKTRQRVVQYRLSDEAALAHYLEHDAERMRGKALEKFGGNFTATRRVLSIAEAALAEQVICANCGNELSGRFCQVCGQREEPRVPTLLSIIREATNALFGLESKLWRSIAVLIFKPGQLTVAYLAGQRQRYTSPLRLYLLFSIAAFAYFAFIGNQGINFNDVIVASGQDAETTVNTQEQSDNLQENRKAEIDANIDAEIDNFQLPESLNVDADTRILLDEFVAQGKDKLKKIKSDVKSGNIVEVISQFLRPLPKALLLFLPFIALAFKFLFLGSGKYYIEHLIYLLHNHAFIFGLVILSALIVQIGKYIPALDDVFSIPITLAWVFYVPFYLYRSLRVVYQRSHWVTIPTFSIIFVVYIIMFSLMLLLSVLFAILVYS